MSRSGYSDYSDNEWSLIRYRGQVASAIRGKRGQALLVELRDALDALPEKKLCDHDLQREDGACCALGAIGRARGIDMTEIDPAEATESGRLADMFNVANQLIREIEFENGDSEYGPIWLPHTKNADGADVNRDGLTREQWTDRADRNRWRRMREWVAEQIRPVPTGISGESDD